MTGSSRDPIVPRFCPAPRRALSHESRATQPPGPVPGTERPPRGPRYLTSALPTADNVEASKPNNLRVSELVSWIRITWDRPACEGDLSSYIMVVLGGTTSYDTEIKVTRSMILVGRYRVCTLQNGVKMSGPSRAVTFTCYPRFSSVSISPTGLIIPGDRLKPSSAPVCSRPVFGAATPDTAGGAVYLTAGRIFTVVHSDVPFSVLVHFLLSSYSVTHHTVW